MSRSNRLCQQPFDERDLQWTTLLLKSEASSTEVCFSLYEEGSRRSLGSLIFNGLVQGRVMEKWWKRELSKKKVSLLAPKTNLNPGCVCSNSDECFLYDVLENF